MNKFLRINPFPPVITMPSHGPLRTPVLPKKEPREMPAKTLMTGMGVKGLVAKNFAPELYGLPSKQPIKGIQHDTPTLRTPPPAMGLFGIELYDIFQATGGSWGLYAFLFVMTMANATVVHPMVDRTDRLLHQLNKENRDPESLQEFRRNMRRYNMGFNVAQVLGALYAATLVMDYNPEAAMILSTLLLLTTAGSGAASQHLIKIQVSRAPKLVVKSVKDQAIDKWEKRIETIETIFAKIKTKWSDSTEQTDFHMDAQFADTEHLITALQVSLEQLKESKLENDMNTAVSDLDQDITRTVELLLQNIEAMRTKSEKWDKSKSEEAKTLLRSLAITINPIKKEDVLPTTRTEADALRQRAAEFQTQARRRKPT